MNTSQSFDPMIVAMIGGVLLLILALVLALSAVLCYMNSRLLSCLPEEHQKIKPRQVWLLMIPFFSIIWNFVVFTQVPESYQSYFDSVDDDTAVGDAGRTVGLWFAILTAVSSVPYLGCLTGPPALVLLILYFIKMFGYMERVTETASAAQAIIDPPPTP